MPDFGFVSQVLSIIVIDLILSGDNAVVIGMAARRLSPENRRRAVIFGGGGAVGLRILFTAMAALLLDVPFLQFLGGVLLLYIAFKLLRPQHHAEHVSEAGSLREAIKTIVLADVVMSLDNILAVGGAAHGDLWLLIFGLLLSIPILLFGSEMVARLLGRLPILVYVGAIVLIWTAITMIFEDDLIHDRYHAAWWHILLISAVASAVIIGVGLVVQRRRTPIESATVARDERETLPSRPWSQSSTSVESSAE
ncbi:MAG: TerC family protein [Thermomicrobiales bacterium]